MCFVFHTSVFGSLAEDLADCSQAQLLLNTDMHSLIFSHARTHARTRTTPRMCYLVLGWNGGQISPVTVMSDVSGRPGGLLVRGRSRAAGGLYLLQSVGKQPGGQLRHIVALGLDHVPRTVHAVPEDVGGRVRLLLPQPRAVHQHCRGHLLRQVRVLHDVVGGHDPGHRAPQGVAATHAQHAGQQRQGKAAGLHSMELGNGRPHTLTLLFTNSRVCAFVTRGDFWVR